MESGVELDSVKAAADPVTVSVEHSERGNWEVEMPDHHRVVCETLDEARRVAFVSAAHTRLCEVIVHDAYHRVLHRELINSHRS